MLLVYTNIWWLITRRFPFSKREFPKKSSVIFMSLCCLSLYNAWEIFREFPWLYYLFLQIWNWWVLFTHEKFLVYKLETFENCKDVKHIMIMIIAISYSSFLSYVIFDQQLKITFRKSSTHSPRKNSKITSPQFLPTLKLF